MGTWQKIVDWNRTSTLNSRKVSVKLIENWAKGGKSNKNSYDYTGRHWEGSEHLGHFNREITELEATCSHPFCSSRLHLATQSVSKCPGQCARLLRKIQIEWRSFVQNDVNFFEINISSSESTYFQLMNNKCILLPFLVTGFSLCFNPNLWNRYDTEVCCHENAKALL